MDKLKVIAVLSIALGGTLSLARAFLPQLPAVPVRIKELSGAYLVVEDEKVNKTTSKDAATVFSMNTDHNQVVPMAIGHGGLSSTLMLGTKYLTAQGDQFVLSNERSFWQKNDPATTMTFTGDLELNSQIFSTLRQGGRFVRFELVRS